MRCAPSRALALLLSAPLLFAATPAARQKAVISDQYRGGFPDDFPAELTLVKTLTPLVQLDVVTRLGFFQYREGFAHPVSIRFDDGAPAITENPFFYVVQTATEGQPFRQDLVANVQAFSEKAKGSGDQEAVLRPPFTYAMAEVIFNDLAGGNPARTLPIWAQEGIAVYVSGMGPSFVERVGSSTKRSQLSELASDLNRPFPILTLGQWARYYLAIQFIVDKYGTSALQAFVRNLTDGRSAADSVRDILGLEWAPFQEQVRAYTTQSFGRYVKDEDQTFGRSGPAAPPNVPTGK